MIVRGFTRFPATPNIGLEAVNMHMSSDLSCALEPDVSEH